MIQVDSAIVIARQQDEVFRFVTNPRNDREWVGFAIDARPITSTPIGVGTRFEQVGSVMGLQVHVVWEITHFEPHDRMVARTLSGPAEFIGTYSLEQAGEGTRVRKSGQIYFSGVLRTMEPVLEPIFQTELRADLKRLKRLLESRAEKGAGDLTTPPVFNA